MDCLATMTHEASLTFLESFGNISEDYSKLPSSQAHNAQTENTDTHSTGTYNADTHSTGTVTAYSPGGIHSTTAAIARGIHSTATAIANGIPGHHAGQLLLPAKEQDLGPRQQQAGLQVIKIIQHIPQCVY